ncbi:MAG: nucleotidyltransferase family protein [Acidobacteria bacterium]|nr:nucleotidyltransferase family protein [Acidobacteriota bacterium]
MKTIAPVVLAAGESGRMGYPKALLPLGQETFLGAILSTLESLGLSRPVVVLGSHAPLIMPVLEGRSVRTLINPDPGRGQLSSMQTAIGSLDPKVTDGCLLWPVDQPCISATIVRDLVRLFFHAEAMLAMPVCQGRKGHPALFRRDLFDEILALPAEASAKRVVSRIGHRTALLPTGEAGTILDMDCPEDYRNLTGESLQRALERRGLLRP